MLPTVSGLDNSDVNVVRLLSFTKEYASKLHPSSKLLNSELVAQASVATPAVVSLVKALAARRKQAVSQAVAAMMGSMISRGSNPVVEVAEAMVEACRAAYERLNRPLVAPMTVATCPLDPIAQREASNFWSSIMSGTANGGVVPAGGFPTATNGLVPEIDAWVAANTPLVVRLFNAAHERHATISRFD